MLGLLHWHVWHAPLWLLTLFWNLQRLVYRYFSVSLMLRTLVAHWHKDAVSYRQGGISKILLAFSWNMISRGIGFIVRVFMLAIYVFIAIGLLVLSTILFGVFIFWPVLAVVGLVVSFQLF